ncbi:phosphotransferase family enzyme [Phyllobacterium myrsinacearum]|uniref:phosphotransferase family protein n=1 Tax=Phyllobacterium myrsinacearum TaxID=28101 RepID=UPI00102A55F3|nr:aminoglycoside phosphotransferase family protein [Phyllobacterium myrsinacearum]RZS83783.1 phosphotransferase family enzyme [Phyllobacterium myrsinacearum]
MAFAGIVYINANAGNRGAGQRQEHKIESEEQTTVPPRAARLVLVTPDGAVVGSLPPMPVDVPWWQEVESVVRAAREQHGIEVTILRLLDVARDRPPGVEVTYLAEIAEPVPAQVWTGRIEAHALRRAYATPGGPAADLGWAEQVLAGHGLAATGKPVQVRTWNLSSVWRIPIGGQSAWLKVVPPFLGHESRIITALRGQRVPELFGHDDSGRLLLAEIPGNDLFEASLPQLLGMVTLLVDMQALWIGRTEELRAMGLPDWRGASLSCEIASVVQRTSAELSGEERSVLRRFVEELPARFAALDACGLPDTLVHGDCHPGNFRGTERQLTLLDWGDSGIGHPLLDQPAFLDGVAPEHAEAIKDHWNRAWLARMPSCDPARAAGLLAPVAAARRAVIYQRFIDNIEPSEHVYHHGDPADWLRRTAALMTA